MAAVPQGGSKRLQGNGVLKKADLPNRLARLRKLLENGQLQNEPGTQNQRILNILKIESSNAFLLCLDKEGVFWGFEEWVADKEGVLEQNGFTQIESKGRADEKAALR